MATVLIIDDDKRVLHLVSTALEKLEVDVQGARTAEEGLEKVREIKPDVVLLDIVLPHASGLQLFREIQSVDQRLPIIFITAGAGSETAIEAMQLGAYDYVAKPLDVAKLSALVGKAPETRRLMNVPVAVPVLDVRPTEGDIFVGRSPQMLEVFKAIGRVAKQNVTVLVRGESGTGKELVSRALYQFSDRRDKPFMAVNCAALPDTLLESELFGHEKGSFTGADRMRIGKFEQCNGGTLLLDEVGDMSALVQGKVLRLLQEQRFERVGGNETIETDVRLIAATNQPLEEMVEAGDFRADWFYRLNGVTVQIPPLAERGEDAPLLLQHYLTSESLALFKKDIEGISPEALEVLQAYTWPGNVRELRSVIRQAVLKATGPVIVPEFLPKELYNDKPPAVSGSEPEDAGGLPPADLRRFVESRLNAGSTDLYAEATEMMERYLFTRVLQATGGNQSKASEVLGITRGKIRDRISAFSISLDKNVSIED